MRRGQRVLVRRPITRRAGRGAQIVSMAAAMVLAAAVVVALGLLADAVAAARQSPGAVQTVTDLSPTTVRPYLLDVSGGPQG